jgi:hypothetical protein
MKPIRVFVEGVGLLGPGLNGWEHGRSVLAGTSAYVPAPTVLASSDLLPAAERRRAVQTVKLVMAVGGEALSQAGRDPAGMATVFTSSGGDAQTVHQICEALATPGREVSPTRFHNSVHNAAAGYWSIATQSREPSTSLCAFDASFAAGLLEAAVQAAVGERPVAFIAYDLPYPEPLHAARPIGAVFAMALALAPEASARAFAMLDMEIVREPAPSGNMENEALEELRLAAPAAWSLPLLAAFARKQSKTVLVDYVAGNQLKIASRIC